MDGRTETVVAIFLVLKFSFESKENNKLLNEKNYYFYWTFLKKKKIYSKKIFLQVSLNWRESNSKFSFLYKFENWNMN